MGVCKFRITGGFPERFLNLCSRNSLPIWDIRREEDIFYAKVIAKNYKRLPVIAKKTGVSIRIVKKTGMPFIAMPYKKRAGFLLGFCLFICMMWFMSQFVWFVTYKDMPEDIKASIVSEADLMGIKPGVLKRSIDAREAMSELQLKIPNISWIAVNTMGCAVEIDARQYDAYYNEVKEGEACNIVAAKTGIIEAVEPLMGNAEVKKGDVVVKGDLLINGVTENDKGGVDMVHSKGRVYARTSYQFIEEIPFYFEQPHFTGRVVYIKRVVLFGFDVPLYFGKKPEGTFEKDVAEHALTIGNTSFPFIYTDEKWYEKKNMFSIISAEKAENIGRERIEQKIAELGNAEITERIDNCEVKDDRVIVTVEISAVEDIARKEPILFE
jgi:similar to stage IV sporulation protein